MVEVINEKQLKSSKYVELARKMIEREKKLIRFIVCETVKFLMYIVIHCIFIIAKLCKIFESVIYY